MSDIPFGTLVTGTLQTNPITTTVLVTTGNLVAGQYLFQIIIAASASSVYSIELLDASDAVVQTTIVRVLANNTLSVPMSGAIQLQTNYELRVVPQTSFTGTVAASILYCCVIC